MVLLITAIESLIKLDLIDVQEQTFLVQYGIPLLIGGSISVAASIMKMIEIGIIPKLHKKRMKLKRKLNIWRKRMNALKSNSRLFAKEIF